MVFRYPFKVVANHSAGLIAVLILLIPTVIALMVQITRFIMHSSTPSNVDKIPLYAFGLVIFFGVILLYACFVGALPYFWSFRTNVEGILARRWPTQRQIAWNDIVQVERVIEATKNSKMIEVELRGLRVVGNETAIKVYDEVGGFEYLCKVVNRECQARGTPMIERDGSWAARRSEAGQQHLKKGLLSKPFSAERPITEL